MTTEKALSFAIVAEGVVTNVVCILEGDDATIAALGAMPAPPRHAARRLMEWAGVQPPAEGRYGCDFRDACWAKAREIQTAIEAGGPPRVASMNQYAH